MEESISNILDQLGHAIHAQIVSANDRARASEAKMARLIDGLSILIGKSASHDNELGDTHIEHRPAPQACESSEQNPDLRAKVSDALFLEALTIEWITAGKLHKLLLARGFKIAEGTVYNRMRKLAAERPDEIETTTNPERWRLKSRTENVGTVTSKMAKRRKQPNASSGLRVVPDARSAANENIAESHMPILHHGNCLEVMKSIPDGSIDLILADLPYGVTRSMGDEMLPLNELWEQYRRILSPIGVVALFAAQPFTTILSSSNLDWLKYSLVWSKRHSSAFLHAKNKPLISHEDIVIFSPGAIFHPGRSKRRMTYNPQGVSSRGVKANTDHRASIRHLGNSRPRQDRKPMESFTGYPGSILEFPKGKALKGTRSHPFSKPIALLEYLIRTYSNPGGMVLDNTMGSGSTCIAAMRTGRRSIGIEKDRQWIELAAARIEQQLAQNPNEEMVA